MATLSDLSGVANSVNGISGLLLVTPNNEGYKPQTQDLINDQQNLPTFLFHYEGEQAVSFESDITDHVAEDNSGLQDQIALRPISVSTRGYIGELNNVVPPELRLLKAAADKLPAVGAFAPAFSATALNAYNTAYQLYQTAKSAAATVRSLSSLGKAQNKQQEAFNTFFGYYKARMLFTVQTPWSAFTNMAIRSVRVIQDEDTNVVTSFDVQFKQMRFASTEVADLDQLQYKATGRAGNQAAPVVDLGNGKTGLSVPFTVG